MLPKEHYSLILWVPFGLELILAQVFLSRILFVAVVVKEMEVVVQLPASTGAAHLMHLLLKKWEANAT
jgi:hypothetical protein